MAPRTSAVTASRRRSGGAGGGSSRGIEPETEALTALEERLGVTFRDRALLARSMVHRSYLNEARRPAEDANERLEFLGDAVIGFVVGRELFQRFPKATEGQLTEMRSQLVRWETLANVATRFGLGEFLVLGRGEERTGGRERPMNLARAFEAVTGAVMEDRTLEVAERFVLRALNPELRMLQPGTSVADAKSRLQTWAQASLGATPIYHIVAVEGPDHARSYRVQVEAAGRVLGEGQGRNKRAAERAAAAQALPAADDLL